MVFDKKKWTGNYYQKNREKIRERMRRWARENPDKVKEYRLKTKAKNLESVKESTRKSHKKWKKKHPEIVKAYNKNRYIKVRGEICSKCGSKEDLHFHHSNYKTGQLPTHE